MADSTTGKGSRRTEEERIEFIRSYRECREVEAHRAFCVPCDAWIPLNPSRRYSMQPWIVHIKACRSGKLGNRQVYVPLTTPFTLLHSLLVGRHRVDCSVIRLHSYVLVSSLASLSQYRHFRPSTPKYPESEAKAEDDDDEQGSVVPSSAGADGRRRPRRTEEERERILKEDPRSGEVRPYEVECTTCKKWIQLGDKVRYRLESWNKHQQSCAGQMCVLAAGQFSEPCR